MDLQAEERELLAKLDLNRMPVHVAIIMDGNGRWARERGLPRSAGHRQGVSALRDTVRFGNYLGFKVLTMFAFSTENWKRPAWEVNFLMGLPEQYLQSELPELVKNNVRVKLIGDPERLPAKARDAVGRGIKATEQNTGMILNFALNYGARQEILQAIRSLVNDARGKKTAPKITEELFASYLYTAGMPDPDLLIRTSGEFRISNFLLWQLAYSEIWITEVYWPDFQRMHMLRALQDFQQRERRFGKV